jgi:hypothetical protein
LAVSKSMLVMVIVVGKCPGYCSTCKCWCDTHFRLCGEANARAVDFMRVMSGEHLSEGIITG